MLKTFLFSTLFIFSAIYANATVYYVNVTQPNNLGNGLSWTNAKKDVQDAINLAAVGDSVWIATGTYLPTAFPPTTATLPVRAKTIFIPDGVKIYGGFNGTETNFNQRNIASNATILSGDFAGNDVITGTISGGGYTFSIAGNSENAYHVVLAVTDTNSVTGATIDGFTISGGCPNISSSSIIVNGKAISSSQGGGIFCFGGKNEISNCRIMHNVGTSGSGIRILYSNQTTIIQKNVIKLNINSAVAIENANSYFFQDSIMNNHNVALEINFGSNNGVEESFFGNNYGLSIRQFQSYVFNVRNCIFYKNRNGYTDGGAISATGGSRDSIIKNLFIENYTQNEGGAIYSVGYSNSKGMISQNVFLKDTASGGGAIYSDGGTRNIVNNVFSANRAEYPTSFSGGGAIYIDGSSDTIANNTFLNNFATYGGAIYFYYGHSEIYNNIIWTNSTGTYSDFYSGYISSPSFTTNFMNNLLPKTIANYSFTGTGPHDLGTFATGNLFAINPQFVDSSNIAGVDGLYRTFDDGLRLKSISPCLNSGLTGFGIPTIDILGTSRPQGVGIDMGAYEKVFCASVSLPINITAFSNLNICNGFPTTLSVSSAQPSDSIFWYADSTSISSLGNGYNFTTNILTATDTFWVSAHNCDSSSGRLPIIVHVNPIITISATPNDTVCTGSPIILTASGANTYSWTGGITNGISFTPIASTTYTVTATDINGCIKTSTQSITLLSIPAINITVSPNDSICAGATVNLTATGASTYTWSGGITNGINFTPTASNTYTVTATALNGCTNTNTQSITVNSLPIINITTLPNDTICAGSSLSLTATGGSTYSWSGSITNATPFTPTTSGTYTVTVTNSSNCSNTSTQSITVNSLPNINITISPNDTICSGTALTLTATGASSYSWSGGITNASPFTPAASNSYTVTATGSNSCTNTATQSIVVKPLISPTISITPSITQGATGDPITYTATTNVPSPFSIDWYRNLALSNSSIINTWNTTIIAGVNNIYAVIKSPTNCLSPDSAKSSSISILNVTGVSTFIPEGFSIYPNPTYNQLIIEGLQKNDKISLYNSLGQLILSENNLDFKPKSINVESYSAGIYIFFFERSNQKWQVKFEKRQ